MRRTLAAFFLAGLAVFIHAAGVSAQPDEPYIETVVTWPPGDEAQRTLVLDPDGRALVPSCVGFRVVGDVICSEPARFSVEVVLDNPDLEPWAGASLEPEDARRLEFTVAQGTHSGAPDYERKSGPNLSIVWDLESAPEDAEYTYHVVVDHARLVPEYNDCTPMLSTRPQLHHAANLTAQAPERGTDGTDGSPTAPRDGGGTPSPGVVATFVAATLALRLGRR